MPNVPVGSVMRYLVRSCSLGGHFGFWVWSLLDSYGCNLVSFLGRCEPIIGICLICDVLRYSVPEQEAFVSRLSEGDGVWAMNQQYFPYILRRGLSRSMASMLKRRYLVRRARLVAPDRPATVPAKRTRIRIQSPKK